MSKENNPVEMDEEGQNFLETVTQELMGQNTLATANFCFLVIGQCSPDGNAVNTVMAIDPSRVAPEHFANCIASILKAADNLGQKMRPMMALSAVVDILGEKVAKEASNEMLESLLSKIREKPFPDPKHEHSEGKDPMSDPNTGEDNVPRYP